jgi:hypothetical protein
MTTNTDTDEAHEEAQHDGIWWRCKQCGELVLEGSSGWRETAKHAKVVHGDVTDASFSALSREEVKAEFSGQA